MNAIVHADYAQQGRPSVSLCLMTGSRSRVLLPFGLTIEDIMQGVSKLRIGELSLGEGFHGVLPWGWIDNRPFLRCMNGFGLCLWRLGRFDEAGRVFDRMLWLNPSDNQGVRFLIDRVGAKAPWEGSR